MQEGFKVGKSKLLIEQKIHKTAFFWRNRIMARYSCATHTLFSTQWSILLDHRTCASELPQVLA